MGDYTEEQRQAAFNAAVRAISERWDFMKKDPSKRMPQETFGQYQNLQQLYPMEGSVAEWLEQAGISVDANHFTQADQEFIGHAGIASQRLMDAPSDAMRTELLEYLSLITAAHEKEPENSRRDLAILGLHAFAKELGITIPNQAAGRARED